MVSANGTAIFIKLAILFLLACLILLFTAAAFMSRSDITTDDEASCFGHPQILSRV